MISRIQIGILMGDNISNIDPATPVGSVHADHTYIKRLGLHDQNSVGIWVRSTQAVNHQWDMIEAHNGPVAGFSDENLGGNAIIWVESGGGINVGHVAVDDYRTLLKTGQFTDNARGVNINSFKLDGNPTQFRLLKMRADSTVAGSRRGIIHISNGVIPGTIETSPIVDAGPGNIRLTNIAHLPDQSIKLTGITSGTSGVCHVHLSGCSINQTSTIEGLIHPASSGPYVLSWDSCYMIFSSALNPDMWGRPLVTEVDGTYIPAGIIMNGVTPAIQ